MQNSKNRSDIRKTLRDIGDKFKRHFSTTGYTEVKSVPISSSVDPTVRFIGSHISVLKPYFLPNPLAKNGIFMVQNCVRTHNVNKLFDDKYTPNWGSFFPSLGVIVPEASLKKLIIETMNFFQDDLGVDRNQIKIRINSIDEKLVDACLELGFEDLFEVDTHPINYYRHTLGDVGVTGRNFNLALKNKKTDFFEDVGNVILIEKDSEIMCVELALGATTILKAIKGLDHVLDCHPIDGLENIPKATKVKLHDAILLCLVLYKEGLRPNGSSNKGRILRTYTRSLSYFRAKTQLSFDDFMEIFSNFERDEFGNHEKPMCVEIANYIQKFENSLKEKKQLSIEEITIRNNLDIK